MIKKIFIFLPVLCLIFLLLVVWNEARQKNKNKTNVLSQTVEKEDDGSIRQKIIYDKFFEDNKKFIKEKYFEDLVIEKDGQKLVVKSLPEITKSAVVLKILKKVSKKSKDLFDKEQLVDQVANEKKQFDSKIQILIDMEKQKMYKYFGNAINSADKYFLDCIND